MAGYATLGGETPWLWRNGGKNFDCGNWTTVFI